MNIKVLIKFRHLEDESIIVTLPKNISLRIFDKQINNKLNRQKFVSIGSGDRSIIIDSGSVKCIELSII